MKRPTAEELLYHPFVLSKCILCFKYLLVKNPKAL